MSRSFAAQLQKPTTQTVTLRSLDAQTGNQVGATATANASNVDARVYTATVAAAVDADDLVELWFIGGALQVMSENRSGPRVSASAIRSGLAFEATAEAARAAAVATDARLPAQPAAAGDISPAPDLSALALEETVEAARVAALAAQTAAEATDARLPAAPAAAGDIPPAPDFSGVALEATAEAARVAALAAQAAAEGIDLSGVGGGLTPAEAEQLARIDARTVGGVSVVVVSPVAEYGRQIELVRGDDYAEADGRALRWIFTGVQLATGATAVLGLADTREPAARTAYPGAVAAGDDGPTLTFELSGEQTQTLQLGSSRYAFDVAAVSNGRNMTLARGFVSVLEQAAA